MSPGLEESFSQSECRHKREKRTGKFRKLRGWICDIQMGKLRKSLAENETNRRQIRSAGTRCCDFL